MLDIPDFNALLVIPRIRIQNANAISAPLTWGFPSLTAFLGLMGALERKMIHADSEFRIAFNSIGIVCHRFDPQVGSTNFFTRKFSLTRNPVKSNGETDSIVEEGRVHLEVSLILGVDAPSEILVSEEERKKMALRISRTIEEMRIAGGTVIPGSSRTPRLEVVDEDIEKRRLAFRKLRRSLLPGFSLVSREDLLQERLDELKEEKADSTPLDAWLDLSRNNVRAVIQDDGQDGESDKIATWVSSRKERRRWIVPIPIGYGSLTGIHPAGSVANTRDSTTPVRFVESAYSIGEWIGPHHLSDARELLWWGHYDEEHGLYRCVNGYKPTREDDHV